MAAHRGMGRTCCVHVVAELAVGTCSDLLLLQPLRTAHPSLPSTWHSQDTAEKKEPKQCLCGRRPGEKHQIRLPAGTPARTAGHLSRAAWSKMLPLCKRSDEVSSIPPSLHFPALIAQQMASPRHTEPASVPLQKCMQMSGLADIMTW